MGELIRAEWVLYLPQGQKEAILNKSLGPVPLDGFLVEAIIDPSDKALLRGRKKIEGKWYKKYLLAASFLVPLRQGNLKVGDVDISVQLASGNIFQFGNPVFEERVKGQVVQVVPLPPGAGPSFTKAVGDFVLESGVNKKQVAINNSVIYKISFKGTGHPRFIRMPDLNFHSDLELYDKTEVQQFSPKGKAAKQYEWILIPRQWGKIKIPGFELQTFDPDLGIYKTHILPAFILEVKGGGEGRLIQKYILPGG